jgi:hypothetical protein
LLAATIAPTAESRGRVLSDSRRELSRMTRSVDKAIVPKTGAPSRQEVEMDWNNYSTRCVAEHIFAEDQKRKTLRYADMAGDMLCESASKQEHVEAIANTLRFEFVGEVIEGILYRDPKHGEFQNSLSVQFEEVDWRQIAAALIEAHRRGLSQ